MCLPPFFLSSLGTSVASWASLPYTRRGAIKGNVALTVDAVLWPTLSSLPPLSFIKAVVIFPVASGGFFFRAPICKVHRERERKKERSVRSKNGNVLRGIQKKFEILYGQIRYLHDDHALLSRRVRNTRYNRMISLRRDKKPPEI